MARLRRDGFAAMESGNTSSGVLTTAPVNFAPDRVDLFVNFVGAVSVDVLDAMSLKSLLGPSELLTGDAVTAQVAWEGVSAPLAAFARAGQALRFRFTLGAATQLYAFWPARDGCGASLGFLGGGGPGAPDGFDSNGRC